MLKRVFFHAVAVCGLVLLVGSSAPLRSQSIFGNITGTVSDTSGATVPDADVLLKNVATGVVRKVTTNADGYYSFSSVPVGSYTLTAQATGFENQVIAGIGVEGAASLSFPFKLKVGKATTEIEVTASADQIIPVDSGEKTVTLTQKQLQDYTIVGADAAEFIKILPGFAQINKQDNMRTGTDFNGTVIGINGNGDGGSQSPLNGAFAANGQGPGNIDITADGAHVSDPGCNCATPVNPNTDMIQEFQVLTSNFGAENAKGPIVINSVAKSGGHDFHGLVAMDARDYSLNSNSWLNNNLSIPKPQNKFFYPEGQIGGPVLIPGTDFNKSRDKLFFFTAFEYYYQTLDTGTVGGNVPSNDMRQGNFTPAALAAAGGSGLTAGGPLNSTLTNCTVSTLSCPFPGGMIPSQYIDKSGLGYLNLYPQPANPGGGNNYNVDEAFNQNSWQWLSRVDYNISDNTKLFVRYNLQKETQQFPVGLWWRNADQIPYPTPVLGKNRSDSVSASLTHVFSPTMSNEFVFAYTYINFPNVFKDPAKVSQKALGIPFNGISNAKIDQIPSITDWGGEMATLLNPSGFQIGGSQGLFATKYLPTVSDTLSKVWGTHTLKFGFYYEFVINNQPSNNNANGEIIDAPWGAGSTGNSWADLLTGFNTQYTQSNKDVLHNEGYNTAEGFVQDSWKVSRRLTLTPGIRISHFGAWYDREGNGFAIFDPSLYVAGSAESSGTGFNWHAKDSKVPLSGFPNRTFFYAPRIGAAYDLFGNGKTVLRGGWGAFYYHNAQFTNGLDTPLGVQSPTLNSVPFNSTDWYALANAKTVTPIESSTFGTAPFAAAGVSSTDNTTPRTYSYSFTVDQRLAFSSLLEVSYVGNHNSNQLNATGTGTEINTVPYGTLFNPKTWGGTGTGPNIGAGEYLYAPYPIYQTINISNHNLYSNYNALQISWVRQKGRYDFTLNYTYGKALGLVGLNQLDLSQDYGAEPFDRRHIFNAAYSVNLPDPVHGNKLAGGFVNGWQLSGITQFQSGVNMTANSTNQGFNATGNITGVYASGYPTSIGNIAVGTQSINGTDQIPLNPILTCNPRANLGPNQYLNGNCFALPTAQGQKSPTVLPAFYGPSFVNSDLALFKNFQISESRKLQLRFSAFNFLNHPVWSFTTSGPGTDALYLHYGPDGNGGATQTNSAFGYAPVKLGSRIIEMSAKFFF
ncbi:MAG TPA: carboxypeptidase-like regulatory domain-containing protein [Terriglobia bacterium]|nr:carboxypeptidase-like regulatory domain-containing protein [Terriglobia bacterium]